MNVDTNSPSCNSKIRAVFLTGTNKESLIQTILHENVDLTGVILPYTSKREERLAEVKNIALNANIPLLRPKRVELKRTLENISPDLLISAGYPYLLTGEQLSISKLNINIHPTLLPKYRGAATTWHVLAAGEKSGGVSIHIIDEGMDTGAILAQEEFPLGPFDTLNSYMRKANALEPLMLRKVIRQISSGSIRPIPQNEQESSTFTEMRGPDDSRIDPSKSLTELYNFIRACDPDRFPAFFDVEGQKVGIRLFRLDLPEEEKDMI